MAQKRKRQKFDWRAVPDAVLLANGPRWSFLPSPASLHPDAKLMDRVCQDDPVAAAIIASWQFRFPVVEVRHE